MIRAMQRHMQTTSNFITRRVTFIQQTNNAVLCHCYVMFAFLFDTHTPVFGALRGEGWGLC